MNKQQNNPNERLTVVTFLWFRYRAVICRDMRPWAVNDNAPTAYVMVLAAVREAMLS